MNRIRLDEDDFRLLIAGKIVDRGTTEIALADIGFDRMLDIIDRLRCKNGCTRCGKSYDDCFCMGGPSDV